MKNCKSVSFFFTFTLKKSKYTKPSLSDLACQTTVSMCQAGSKTEIILVIISTCTCFILDDPRENTLTQLTSIYRILCTVSIPIYAYWDVSDNWTGIDFRV